YEEWQYQRDRIAKLYSLSTQQLKEKKINLDSIVNDANDREKELSKLSDVFAKEYEKKQVKWEDVQNALKLDEAAVEIIRFRYSIKGHFTDTVYYAALINRRRLPPPAPKSSGDMRIVLLTNGNDLETASVLNYNKNVMNKSQDYDSYNLFWAAIAKELYGIKKVYFSPDGVYNQLNLNTIYNPATQKYVIDEIDIHLVGSTRDLVNNTQNLTSPLVKSAELFGDPKFNLDSTEHLQLTRNYTRTDMANIDRGVLDSLTKRGGISPLPGTRKEVENIGELLKQQNWDVKSHLGDEALEEALKSVKNPGILHIATHGVFMKDIENTNESGRAFGMDTKRYIENPLLKSMLLFAGAEKTINNQGKNFSDIRLDDGLLTAYEAQNLNLDKTDLVVLSACETGLGEIKNGEGVYGLQRAFIQAGAKSLIMSLWNVSDEATQELMTTFYKEWLSGKSKREAFKNAQQEIRAKYKDPYYWGAFVIVGE
ncbi:MAG: CHAT domain-containing protein, partial [FCB group bacterium]